MTRLPQFPSPRRPLPDDTAPSAGLNRSLSHRLNRRLSRRDLLALAGAAGLAGCGGGSTDPAPAAAPAAADTPLAHPLGVATGGTGGDKGSGSRVSSDAQDSATSVPR